MSVISAKSPARVDLAGGTLDLWPLYTFVENSKTINLAISIFTYCSIETRSDATIIIESEDQKLRFEFSSLAELLGATDPRLHFFKSHIKFWMPPMGFHLKTKSESPIGAGLGGSSSLSISVIKCFCQLMNRSLDLKAMVEIAHNIEAEILNTPTGIQDYIPAIQPGLNTITFKHDGYTVSKSVFPNEVYRESALLVYTGRPHQSGLNNFEVLKNAISRNDKTITALEQIRDVTLELDSVIKKQNWRSLPDLFEREYQARIKLTPAFTSPEIEKVEKLSKQAGASAIKICGAGGGGCVMVWAPGSKEKVASTLKANKVQILDVELVNG